MGLWVGINRMHERGARQAEKQVGKLFQGSAYRSISQAPRSKDKGPIRDMKEADTHGKGN